MRNILKSLKLEGKLAVMVYDPIKTGNLQGHAVSHDQIIHQAKEAGYRLTKMDTSLSKDTIYIFCKVDYERDLIFRIKHGENDERK